MQSCSNCFSRNKIFTFHNDATNYESAIQKCRNKNPRQNIATFLNDADYRKLLACCRNRISYWIGLKNEDRTCRNENRRLRWNSSGRCFDGRPLNVQPQPTNRECIAVIIETRTPDSGNIIQAGLNSCQQTHGYICEQLIDNSPKQRSTTAASSTRITTATSTQTPPVLATNFTESTYNASITRTYNQQVMTENIGTSYVPYTHVSRISTNPSSSSRPKESSSNIYLGPVVGAVVVLIILLVIIAFLYRRYYKANSRCLPFKISSQFTKHNSPRKSNSISRFSTKEPNSFQHNIEVIKESDYQLAEGFIEQNEYNGTTEKKLNFNDQTQTIEEKNPYESFDDTDFSDDEAQGSSDQHSQASTETKKRICNDTKTPAIYASVIKSKNITEECAYAIVNKNK